MNNDPARIILHFDMDSFYASVEMMPRPELNGKPVVIGADPTLQIESDSTCPEEGCSPKAKPPLPVPTLDWSKDVAKLNPSILYKVAPSNKAITPGVVNGKWDHQWVFLYSCLSLYDKAWYNGLKPGRGRGMLGFETMTFVYPEFMTTVADYMLMGHSISKSWFIANCKTNGKDKVARHGHGVIAVAIFQNEDMMKNDLLPQGYGVSNSNPTDTSCRQGHPIISRSNSMPGCDNPTDPVIKTTPLTTISCPAQKPTKK